MKKKILALSACILLASCSLVRVHKLNIMQGNILTPDKVSQIHTGMSQEKTEDILGTPMLINTFDDNRVDYVYTYKPAYGNTEEKRLTLIFRNHILREIL